VDGSYAANPFYSPLFGTIFIRSTTYNMETNNFKTCSCCKLTKSISEFNKDSSRKDGLQNRCRFCKRQQDKKYSQSHREQIAKRSKEWRENNLERAKENIKRWHKEHPERVRQLTRESWKRAPKEKKLRKSISVAIKRSLKGKAFSKTIFNKLGYTVKQLKEHIEKQFKEGMSWDNHGDWHIDHVIPQSFLPFTSIEDENFIKCWSLSNLQPLWAKDNLSKQDRFIG
jgi:hypothetical protein